MMKFLIAAPNNLAQITWPMHLVHLLGLPTGNYRLQLWDRQQVEFNHDRHYAGKLGINSTKKQWTLSGMKKLRDRANALAKAQVDIFLCWVEQPRTICFALPRWNEDDELARLHLVAWDFIVERAIRKEGTIDEQLFNKLKATAPEHFLYGHPAMDVFWRNIDQCCMELGIPSLKDWRSEESPPTNSRPTWPKTALNPFKDEKQAIETYCREQGFSDEQREEIEKLEKRYPDFFANVLSRGAAQTHFRTSLLFAYDRKCAFCDFAVEEALEAAHIVPWVDCANDEERKDSANGFLLCATHHRLFDRGRLKVTNDLTIEINPNEGPMKGTDRAEDFGLRGNPVRINFPEKQREKRIAFIKRRNGH